PLIGASKELAAGSAQLFNPAAGKLTELWGFQDMHPGRRQPPDTASIEALVKAKPLMSDLEVDDILLRTGNPALKLDFGPMQTGYAVDRVIDHLQELGIHNAILNIGGDLRAIGTRSGQPWPVAIRNPSGGGVLGIIQVSGNESVFTAGDYERNFTYKGKSYHHLIDPRTGWPATGAHLVTVLHADATTADAATHALMIAGPDHWYETARALGVRSVLLVDAQGRIHLDPSMARRVELLDRNAQVIEAPPLTLGSISLPGP
ncbi:MAG: FAD:protein FMN transferase, partial [Gammaproteobacteria bacterium]|nr:FAD:protein FMN transferase [Gammaproteobacteria bacterium]